MPVDESSDLATVIASINTERLGPLTLVRRYEVGSGAGAHEVTTANGTPLVLKWWVATGRERHRFDVRHERIPKLRAIGWPIPEIAASDATATYLYELWAKSPGRPGVSAPSPASVIARSSQLVECARGAALGDGTDWAGWLQSFIDDKLSHVDQSSDSLVKEIVELCRKSVATVVAPPGRDLIHGDFTPANLLIDHDQIIAIVDLDDCRDGDGTLDLMGIVWDLDGWGKGSQSTINALWAAIHKRVDPDYGRLLLAYWIAGTLAWAVGTEDESAKVAQSLRTWHRF